MTNIYFISGLAADERVFQHLQLHDAEIKHLHWQKPLPGEDLQAYARRLSAQVNELKPAVLVGYSFGGIVAQEMAKFVPTCQVIIISSIKSPKEMPWYLELVRLSQLYKIAPIKPFARIEPLTCFFFGACSTEGQRLLKDLILKADDEILHWSVNQLMSWSPNTSFPKNITHIHGTEDRIFPAENIKNAILIPGGTHYMVVEQPEKVSKLLRQAIDCGVTLP